MLYEKGGENRMSYVNVNNKSNSEKYKNNVLYKGPVLWNSHSVQDRNVKSYEKLKSVLIKEAMNLTVPVIL